MPIFLHFLRVSEILANNLNIFEYWDWINELLTIHNHLSCRLRILRRKYKLAILFRMTMKNCWSPRIPMGIASSKDFSLTIIFSSRFIFSYPSSFFYSYSVAAPGSTFSRSPLSTSSSTAKVYSNPLKNTLSLSFIRNWVKMLTVLEVVPLKTARLLVSFLFSCVGGFYALGWRTWQYFLQKSC